MYTYTYVHMHAYHTCIHACIYYTCAHIQIQCVETLKLNISMYYSIIVCILYTTSDGVGQSGAFCAISIAIERVKAEGTVDIFHGVKHLRTQCPHMVQTLVRMNTIVVPLKMAVHDGRGYLMQKHASLV